MAQFAVGDKVQWTSQAGGYTKTKTGTVMVVVPAQTSPHEVHLPEVPCTLTKGIGMSTRLHESYLVHVQGRRELYWPVVSLLRRLE